MILSSVMFLTVVFADPEGDGSFNYLFQRNNSALDHQYSIALSSATDLNLKSGDLLYADVEATCALAWALDPVSKEMQNSMPWGSPRKIYICNADSVGINGKKYQSTTRSNNE